MSKSSASSKEAAEKKAAPVVDQSARKSVDLALSAITKQFGEGTIMRMGDAHKMKVDTLSTGSLAIDLALGVGGLPRGRIMEIYGPESSGKTTFCLSSTIFLDYSAFFYQKRCHIYLTSVNTIYK